MDEDVRFEAICKPKFELLGDGLKELKDDVQDLRKEYGVSTSQLITDMTEVKKGLTYLISKNGNGGNGSKGTSQSIVNKIIAKPEEGELVSGARTLEKVWGILPISWRLPMGLFLFYMLAQIFNLLGDKIRTLVVMAWTSLFK